MNSRLTIGWSDSLIGCLIGNLIDGWIDGSLNLILIVWIDGSLINDSLIDNNSAIGDSLIIESIGLIDI